MPDRFYVPGVWSDHVELDGTEAHHLTKVLRGKIGDKIELFNGKGLSADAEVVEVKKRTAMLKLISASRLTSKTQPEIVVAVASPKGDRLRWMIEKMTELGVDRFIPLKTTRSVVDPSESKLEKLEQTVIGACKQCRRDWLLEIDDTCPLGQLSSRLNTNSAWVVWGDADGPSWSTVTRPHPQTQQLVAIVGPEGGFTEQEKVELRESSFSPISSSRNVLRIETAAISLATLLQTYRE